LIAPGRVVIPKMLRDLVSLGHPQSIEISERDGKIEIEATCSPSLMERGRGIETAPDGEFADADR
jgi:bifunctional DNA-binding transcriptional regulator/antitoxin component of YhaV-PrlF toxin-antitoxin module